MVGGRSTSDQSGFGSGGVRRSEHGVSKVRHGMEGIDGLEVSLNALVDGPSRENAADRGDCRREEGCCGGRVLRVVLLTVRRWRESGLEGWTRTRRKHG